MKHGVWLAEPYGLANQKLCNILMCLSWKKRQGMFWEGLVNTGPSLVLPSEFSSLFSFIAISILSFNYASIHAISPMIYYFWYTTDIFRTKTDIPRIFLEYECTFCGETSRFMTQSTSFMTSLQRLIHFHILLNSYLSVLEITKLNKSYVER